MQDNSSYLPHVCWYESNSCANSCVNVLAKSRAFKRESPPNYGKRIQIITNEYVKAKTHLPVFKDYFVSATAM